MKFIKDKGVEKSSEMANKRGVFPNYKDSQWKKKNIKIRNATITTIAPTGSISILAGASSGIEPLFALGYIRKISIGDFIEIHPLFEENAKEIGFYSDGLMKEIIEKGSIKDIEGIPNDVKEMYVTTMDISMDWHIKMQAAFQKYVDNAVSKTINLPSDATVDDIRGAYLLAYRINCKGLTVYRDKSRDEQVLNIGKSEEKKEEGHRKLTPRKRPAYTRGMTVKIRTGCGNMYITINEDEEGLCEVFAQLGKTGGCPASQTEANARLISLSLRSGIEVHSVIRELRGIRCPSPIRVKEGFVLSCSDAMGIALETYLNEVSEREEENKERKVTSLKIDNHNVNEFMKSASTKKKADNAYSMVEAKNPVICPDCGSQMFYVEGCSLCPICGFSRCD